MRGFYPQLTKPVDHVGTSDHKAKKKRYVSISTRAVAIKLERMVGYDKEPKI